MSDDYRTRIGSAIRQGSQLIMVGEYPTDTVLEYLRQADDLHGAIMCITRNGYILSLVDRDGSKRTFVYEDGKWVEHE